MNYFVLMNDYNLCISRNYLFFKKISELDNYYPSLKSPIQTLSPNTKEKKKYDFCHLSIKLSYLTCKFNIDPWNYLKEPKWQRSQWDSSYVLLFNPFSNFTKKTSSLLVFQQVYKSKWRKSQEELRNEWRESRGFKLMWREEKEEEKRSLSWPNSKAYDRHMTRY